MSDMQYANDERSPYGISLVSQELEAQQVRNYAFNLWLNMQQVIKLEEEMLPNYLTDPDSWYLTEEEARGVELWWAIEAMEMKDG